MDANKRQNKWLVLFIPRQLYLQGADVGGNVGWCESEAVDVDWWVRGWCWIRLYHCNLESLMATMVLLSLCYHENPRLYGFLSKQQSDKHRDRAISSQSVILRRFMLTFCTIKRLFSNVFMPKSIIIYVSVTPLHCASEYCYVKYWHDHCQNDGEKFLIRSVVWTPLLECVISSPGAKQHSFS